ncbi:MAG: UDP-N-acetylglucosamine 2-epimerase (hydrolyzing) [Clostridiales bacterium]|nr:UDP-N-acetylglucosamine 2-epimerase (hydrolyzing) [Clostridiales bacterium]
MKNVAVVTATRAEYGLLSPVIRHLREHESKDFKVSLIVTGTHLSDQYGMTINDISERIDYKIPVSVNSGTSLNISENQAQALVEFTRLFMKEIFDGILLLGDRYETLAVAIAAGNTGTPVFHMCGGDTTQGALDEWMRHSITKISYLHFVTNEESKKRVIQLGEDPERVFNYGSTGVDNILVMADMTKEEALSSIGLNDCGYVLCTYHPVTMEDGSVDEQIENFLKAITLYPDMQFIVTKSNADKGGARINELLDKAENKIGNIHVYASLGVRRYLSLMKYAQLVLGNSSSGIIETPAFKVPAVNIGDRQKGRLQGVNTVNCGPSAAEIAQAIKTAMSEEHKKLSKTVINPYGDGNASSKIARKITETVMCGRIDLKKKFYDLD